MKQVFQFFLVYLFQNSQQEQTFVNFWVTALRWLIFVVSLRQLLPIINNFKTNPTNINFTIITMNNSSIQPANITLSHFLSGNYGDLLRYSGLSHLQFSLLVIAIFLVMSFIYLLFKLGMLQGVNFRQQAIQQSTLIYKSYYGPNHQISTAFAQVIQDTNTVFKFSDSFAIYYQQNQKDTLNKKGDQLNKVKALFGIVVNKIEQSKTDLFISKFKQYRTAMIPKTRCVSTKYPYFNQMSFIAIVNRVYSQMKKYIDKKGIKVAPLTIQLYHLLGKQQFIRIMRPRENFDAFDLWQLPQQKQRSFRRPKRQ